VPTQGLAGRLTQSSEGGEGADWITRSDAVQKWTVALAYNDEAIRLEHSVRLLVEQSGLSDSSPVWQVAPAQNSAADRLRYCKEALELLRRARAKEAKKK
jgi:hypothetical protein